MQVKKSWQLAERWAYEGDLPPPEALRKKILVDNPARLYEF